MSASCRNAAPTPAGASGFALCLATAYKWRQYKGLQTHPFLPRSRSATLHPSSFTSLQTHGLTARAPRR
jgi:hypothetical protein